MSEPRKFYPNKTNLCINEVCRILGEEHGLLGPTAERLGIKRTALRHFVMTRHKCVTALKEARNAVGDKAEGKLYELIEAGDYRAVIFYLTTLCKDRGYVLPRGAPPPADDVPEAPVVYRTAEEIRRELERRGISFEAIERLRRPRPIEQVEYIEDTEQVQ